ncbi:MAG: hypothetical protein AB1832_01140 [Pseudomonadota bacterium]
MPVPAYRPLDHRLTDPIPDPPPPPANCTWQGQPIVCVLDGLAQIPLYQGRLQQSNADRATAARLTEQPGEQGK